MSRIYRKAIGGMLIEFMTTGLIYKDRPTILYPYSWLKSPIGIRLIEEEQRVHLVRVGDHWPDFYYLNQQLLQDFRARCVFPITSLERKRHER